MIVEAFFTQVKFWLADLGRYEFEKIIIKPSANSWSIAQVYMHIINDTAWYFDQADRCFGNEDHKHESKNSAGVKLFKENGFPDVKILGEVNEEPIKQPESIVEIQQKMEALLFKASEIYAKTLEQNVIFGKSEHPGFGYFTPLDWIRFGEMHMRHHVKQKLEIEKFLMINNL